MGALRDAEQLLSEMTPGEKAGQAIPDEDVLAFARAKGRIFLTLNRKHFIRLHNQNPDHPGIVVCTFDPDLMPWHTASMQNWNSELKLWGN